LVRLVDWTAGESNGQGSGTHHEGKEEAEGGGKAQAVSAYKQQFGKSSATTIAPAKK
jgi:hypothetical protein